MAAKTLHFTMERCDDEDGVYYVISGVEIALVTDGQTVEETLRNLREAVELHFEGDDPSEITPMKAVVTGDWEPETVKFQFSIGEPS